MRTKQRPASRNAASPPQRPATAARPLRKVFNCIADDTALVAGIKKTTRNGIRRWVENGQIRLFVPLHALSVLQARRDSEKGRHAADIKESLEWLDDATSKYPQFVILQGPEETFEKWAEVQKFSVPRTLFSEYDHDNEAGSIEYLADDVETRLTLANGGDKAHAASSEATEGSRSLSPASQDSIRSSQSPLSPPSSPGKAALSPVRNIASVTTRDSRPIPANGSVPLELQPLFNYILWRVHQESDPVAALESFIFLCNDGYKVHFAKGFDIRTKRLEQLREAVGREDREFKNRQSLLERESQTATTENSTPTAPAEDQDDEVVFKPAPPKMPAAMLGKQKSTVIDPNAFSRNTQASPSQEKIMGTQKSPRTSAPVSRGSPRGSHVSPFSPRSGNIRGNGRGAFRGAQRSRGRGDFVPITRGALVTDASMVPAGQIDPDSFSRPGPHNGPGGGRGGRRLWVPT